MAEWQDALTLTNAAGAISRAVAWLDRFALRAALPATATSKLQVALDEMLTNVLRHALAGAPEGTRQIGLQARRLAHCAQLEVVDDGPVFDPTRAVAERSATRITQRRPGGVGLLFVRTLMDDVQFVRQDGRNRLTLTVELQGEDEGGAGVLEILEAAGDGSAVLHVAGRVNSANAPELGERLRDLMGRGFRLIVIDLSRLVHMTSAGFRSLLRADRQAEEGGARLVLCGLHGLTLELFEIGGFLEMFTVASTRDEAVRRASGR